MLSDGALRKSGLFKPQAVQHLVKKMQSGEHTSETDEMALTGIVTAQLTHEHFIQNFKTPDARTVTPQLMIDRR